MASVNGRQRVLIRNVSPRIDEGKYPAKAIVGKTFPVTVEIFADGHDTVEAALLIKHKEEKQWTEFALTLVENDCWQINTTLFKQGFYQFKIQAWINHYLTWLKGFEKKISANQEIQEELKIASALLAEAATHASSKNKAQLLKWSEEMQLFTDASVALKFAGNAELITAVQLARDKKFTTVYDQILEIEVERERADFSAWYELFLRSAGGERSPHGTFNDVKKILPNIADLGFDILYLPPIHPIGEQKRKGRNNSLNAAPDDPGSPWAIGSIKGGHKSIHPQLGTLKEFQGLIKEAKKLKLEIAMDIAFQCAPDHPYVKLHPEWFKWRPDGTVQYAENPPKKYEDILPFNFETEDWENLWEELKSVFDYWISNGVNIFRVDNPHTKPLAFWEWAINAIRSENPDVIFLAEAFTRPRIMEQLARIGFTQSYTYFTWRNTKKELETYITELTKTSLRYYFRPNFWPNTPDILPDSLVYGGENAHVIRLLLAATLSSNYGVYGPVYENCINAVVEGKEEYSDNEKYEIKKWNWSQYTRIKEMMWRINKIRNGNAALKDTYNIELIETSNDQIICYCKKDNTSGNTLIIAVNLDAHNTQSAYVKIPMAQLNLHYDQAYSLNDLLSGDTYQWYNEWNYVQLNPSLMPAHIFLLDENHSS